MKKSIKTLRFFILLALLFLCFVSPFASSAQTTTADTKLGYVLLTSLPGIPNSNFSLKEYLIGIFKLTIAVAGVLAVFKIVIGGWQYMVSEAIGGKEQGKENIQSALWGLILAMVAYLILVTINPDLVKLDVVLETPPFVAVDPSPTDRFEDNTVRDLFSSNNPTITVNKPACPDGVSFQQVAGGCTSVGGLTLAAINGVRRIATNCPCSLVVTGGSELGHSATGGHSQGRAVDLAPDVRLNVFFVGNPFPAEGVRGTKDGYTYVYETEGGNPGHTSTGAHWHVVF